MLSAGTQTPREISAPASAKHLAIAQPKPCLIGGGSDMGLVEREIERGRWQCLGKLGLCVDLIRQLDSTLVCNNTVDTIRLIHVSK